MKENMTGLRNDVRNNVAVAVTTVGGGDGDGAANRCLKGG